MNEVIETTLLNIENNLGRIADALETIAEKTPGMIITGEAKSGDNLPRITELTAPKYKENTEIGKGEVMAKTCGIEVCRCLRNDGSCAAHHPEFCSKCIKLNQ